MLRLIKLSATTASLLLVGIANAKRTTPSAINMDLDPNGNMSALMQEEEGSQGKFWWKKFIYFGDDKNGPESLKLAAERLEKYKNHFTLMEGENIEQAYKKGRDSMMLTNKRYIFIDAVKFSSKVTFTTIPYSSILGYATETAGAFFDSDVEMELYTNMIERPFIKIDFKAGVVDIFEIQKYLCDKVMGNSYSFGKSLAQVESRTDGPNSFAAFLKGEGVEIDPAKYEEMLRDKEAPVLQDDEKVEAAFKIARDSMVLTSKRIMLIDVQGLTGKKVEYKSLPYSSIGAYLVETAGGIFSGDTDSELKIWTTIPYGPMVSFEREIRKGLGDILKVQMILSQHVLGGENSDFDKYGKSLLERDSKIGQSDVSIRSGKGGKQPGAIEGLLAKFGDDAVQISPQAAESQLESSAKILIGGEHVQLAFKVGKDMTLMTTHRIIFVDVQKQSKVEYKSIPYSHVMGFAIETAGAFDSDAEMKIWTDIAPDPNIPPEPPLKDCPPCPEGQICSCPKVYVHPWADRKKGMAYFEQDLRKGYADVFAIQKLLAEKTMGGKAVSSLIDLSDSSAKTDQQAPFGGLVAWLGNDASQVSASSVEQTLRTSQPVLMKDETVGLPFKVGKDLTVLTSHRVLLIDTKSRWGGQSVEYKSIPYKHIRAYSVESAGAGFYSDSEMEFFTKFTWPLSGKKSFGCKMDRKCLTLGSDKPFYKEMIVHQDLRKDKANLTEIQKFISERLLEKSSGSSLLELDRERFDPMAWLNAAHKEVDLKEAEETLLKEIDPFIKGETLWKAYQTGRDLIYVTNKRMLVKDRQGVFGKKVEYKSIPFTSITGLSLKSAGWFLDVDEELWFETDSWSMRSVEKSFHKKEAKIKEVFDKMSGALY